MNKAILWVIYCSSLIPIMSNAQIDIKKNDEDNKRLSYYIGYLIWRDYLNKLDTNYDVEQILQGIKDGGAGICHFKDQEDLADLVKKFKLNRTTQHSEKNLKEAEKYLSQVSQIPQIVEVCKERLYYLISEPGNPTQTNSPLLFKFNIKQLNDGELKLFYSTPSPIELNIEEAIEGFKEGVKGIKKGEKRIIYIHPTLAYGMGRVCIPPNVLIVFEVEAL